MYNEKKIKLKQISEIPLSIIKRSYKEYKNGNISEQEAKNQVIKHINTIRYDNGTNYFWIHNFNTYMVFHPIAKQLNGKDISNYKDPNGTVIKGQSGLPFFLEMTKIVKEKNEGYVEYRWPKPNDLSKYLQKLSYVIGFKEWNWIIGTGIYIDDINKEIYSFILSSLLILFFSLAVSIFISIYFAKNITNPINALLNLADNIAKKTLNQSINKSITNRKDEVGNLGNSLSKMNDNLKIIISNLQEVSSTLSLNTDELENAAIKLSDGTQSQAASTEETSASIEEFTAAISQINDNINSINTHGKELTNTATSNASLIEDAVKSMDKIVETSEKISEILVLINDIADQTNLLALNAAIEAARAGEHGKGFAVVADEIAKLADKSSESAKQIGKLIKGSVEDLTIGTAIVKNTGDAFNKIIDGINENQKLMNDIVLAIEQQYTVSMEVQNSVEDINEVTQDVSASAEQLSAATVNISNQADNIKTMINEFKL